MPRLLLTLFPVAALVALVALSCGRPHSDEPATRVIPPPPSYTEPAARAAAAAAVVPRPSADEPPTAEELKEFQRPVPK